MNQPGKKSDPVESEPTKIVPADPESWEERPDSEADLEQRYEAQRPPHHGG